MIKISEPVLASPDQMLFIIEGMRNPLNSWAKSDSFKFHAHAEEIDEPLFSLGDSDRSLMTRLAKAGTEHAKYLRMMPVMMRVTAPLYWWKEFDTYKVGTVANSCSTMHKIAAKEFSLDDFSLDLLITESDGDPELHESYSNFVHLVDSLNNLRLRYLETKDNKYWRAMIEMLPSSYNQTRNISLNYAVLENIYHQRRNHKLDEWHVFCDWIEWLPYSYLITGKGTSL